MALTDDKADMSYIQREIRQKVREGRRPRSKAYLLSNKHFRKCNRYYLITCLRNAYNKLQDFQHSFEIVNIIAIINENLFWSYF